MMNVLSDMCDTSSMMVPQGYKVVLQQNNISPHDISSEQGPLHLLESASHICNLDSPLNHSSPSEINIFNSSSQIHIPSNIDSAFEDRSNVSVFSDSFPEIVPSWLTHDFMKVSDNLPSPGLLSNVSDIYSTDRETDHLKMLDLGFPPELTSHDVSSNLNQSYVDSQKILVELPMQRFSSNDPLIIPSFNDVSNTHLHISMNKNDIQYQKYKQNEMHPPQTLMNTVLPCDNDLLHLPLPSNLTDQCLNSSSPSMISNSQSQSHPVDVVCDKLPQINLNHLNSLLENKPTLSDIRLLRHDFPNVRLGEDGSNSHVTRKCLDTYNHSNGSLMTGNILSSDIPRLTHSQDASVQVSFEALTADNVTADNCFSCNSVKLEMPIETIQCFKCKFCDYISIHKCAVASHINMSHSKTSASNISESTLKSDHFNPVSIGSQSETHFHTNGMPHNATSVAPIVNSSLNSTIMVSSSNSITNIDRYNCLQCNAVFSNIDDYNSHLLSNHNVQQPEQVQMSLGFHSLIGYPPVSVDNITLNAPSKGQSNQDNKILANHTSKASQNISSKISKKRKILPKKTDNDQTPRKAHPKKSGCEINMEKNEKTISSHKKAWQKKINRELGTYICEFKSCSVRFRALDNLEYHRKCHSVGASAFACPECGTNFDNWGAIAGHLWRTHGNDMELHKCDQCPFRTFSLSRLENIHKRIHSDECLFLCDTCGKKFKSGKQLRNHRVIHSKPKDNKGVKCNICQNFFSSKRRLLCHQNTVHNEIKPFSCKYCDYSASKKCTMELHMRTHTGEKPFKCDQCEYCTSDHNTLRRHKMQHTGDKPYKCPLCPYSCIQAYRYKEHFKQHPGQNVSSIFCICNICSFRTIKQEIFLKHMCEHERQNRPIGESSAPEIHSTDDIFPLAEAMDISLSRGVNLLSNFNNTRIFSHFLTV